MISFTPIAAYKSSKHFKLYLFKIFSRAEAFKISFNVNPCFLNSFSQRSFPFYILSSRLARLIHDLIFLLALLLLAMVIQSILGPLALEEVITSTISPVFK